MRTALTPNKLERQCGQRQRPSRLQGRRSLEARRRLRGWALPAFRPPQPPLVGLGAADRLRPGEGSSRMAASATLILRESPR